MNCNWKMICQIADYFLRMALAFANPKTDEGKKLMAAFPECFSETPIGPVPLSVLREFEKKEYPKESRDFLASHDAIRHFGLPSIEYGLDDDASKEWNVPLLPQKFFAAEVGCILELQGQKFVVVENNQNPGVFVMYLVPAHAIDVNS